MKEYKRLTKKADVTLLDCEYACGSLQIDVIQRLGELEDKIENGTLREVTPLNSEEAQYFAGKMEDYLNIPAMVCELIERKLKQGNFEEVVRYIIQRKKELQEKGE